jgi:endonuclease YncB( thermonuclease family)
MVRTFIEKGIWQITVSNSFSADIQKMATLRVSALAGIITLGLMVGPELRETQVIRAPAPVITSTIPEMVSAKSNDRVPNFEDITSLAPARHKARPDSDVTALSTSSSDQKPYAGIEVVNATTLRSAGMTVRLAGIALPKAEQSCRRLDGLDVSCTDRAISYLQLLVKGRSVACDKAGIASDGVEKGRCRIGETDIAEQMVRQGWAKASDNPDGRLVVAEAAARKQKLGIWRGL